MKKSVYTWRRVLALALILVMAVTYMPFLSEPSAYAEAEEEVSEKVVELSDTEQKANKAKAVAEVEDKLGIVEEPEAEEEAKEAEAEDLQGNDITDQWRAETSVDEVRTIIKNKPHSPGSEVTIMKTGPDSSQTLPGAHFALYADDYYLPDGTTVNPEAQPMDGKSNLVSGDSGLISLGLLEDGTYYLAETQPPDGYQILTRPVTIVVNSQNTQIKRIDGKDYPPSP